MYACEPKRTFGDGQVGTRHPKVNFATPNTALSISAYRYSASSNNRLELPRRPGVDFEYILGADPIAGIGGDAFLNYRAGDHRMTFRSADYPFYGLWTLLVIVGLIIQTIPVFFNRDDARSHRRVSARNSADRHSHCLRWHALSRLRGRLQAYEIACYEIGNGEIGPEGPDRVAVCVGEQDGEPS